jgi:hypothetical protein
MSLTQKYTMLSSFANPTRFIGAGWLGSIESQAHMTKLARATATVDRATMPALTARSLGIRSNLSVGVMAMPKLQSAVRAITANQSRVSVVNRELRSMRRIEAMLNTELASAQTRLLAEPIAGAIAQLRSSYVIGGADALTKSFASLYALERQSLGLDLYRTMGPIQAMSKVAAAKYAGPFTAASMFDQSAISSLLDNAIEASDRSTGSDLLIAQPDTLPAERRAAWLRIRRDRDAVDLLLILATVYKFGLLDWPLHEFVAFCEALVKAIHG